MRDDSFLIVCRCLAGVDCRLRVICYAHHCETNKAKTVQHCINLMSFLCPTLPCLIGVCVGWLFGHIIRIQFINFPWLLSATKQLRHCFPRRVWYRLNHHTVLSTTQRIHSVLPIDMTCNSLQCYVQAILLSCTVVGGGEGTLQRIGTFLCRHGKNLVSHFNQSTCMHRRTFCMFLLHVRGRHLDNWPAWFNIGVVDLWLEALLPPPSSLHWWIVTHCWASVHILAAAVT